jgi:hypothetical protein
MVRDDMGDEYVPAYHRLFLLNGDYDVEIVMSVEVNDTGGLAPTVSYLNPISATANFMFGASGTLSESRDHNFTENIQLSVRKIYADWKTNANPHDCPEPNTNLAGTLGLKDFVAMAALTPDLDEKQTLSGTGVFGGSIQFLVTKNLSAVGPTFTLVHFTGPGPLGSLSEVNTDKLTIAFAQGPNVGKPMRPAAMARGPNPPNARAAFFINQLLTTSVNSQLNSQLNLLQNRLH